MIARLLYLAFLLLAAPFVATAFTYGSENLFPGIGTGIQRLRFHTGRTANNKPEISSTLPEIFGPPSQWYVTQWSQEEVLDAGHMTTDDPSTADMFLGVAKYAFTTSDRHSHVRIYQESNTNRVIYELYERDGALSSLGGANIFLSSDAPPHGFSLDHSIEYRLDAKISKARIDATAQARESGIVLAQVFTGFVIQFPEATGKGITTVFLQVPISGSSINSKDYMSCSVTSDGRTIIFNGAQQGELPLSFKSDNGPLKHLRFKITDYLCELVSHPVACSDPAGGLQGWSLQAEHSFHDWKIKNIYVGLETQNRDTRPQSSDHRPQGHVEVALQLTDLQLIADPTEPIDPSICSKR